MNWQPRIARGNVTLFSLVLDVCLYKPQTPNRAATKQCVPKLISFKWWLSYSRGRQRLVGLSCMCVKNLPWKCHSHGPF